MIASEVHRVASYIIFDFGQSYPVSQLPFAKRPWNKHKTSYLTIMDGKTSIHVRPFNDRLACS